MSASLPKDYYLAAEEKPAIVRLLSTHIETFYKTAISYSLFAVCTEPICNRKPPASFVGGFLRHPYREEPNRALHVAAPTTPSGSSPKLRCAALTAARVSAPNTPSAEPLRNPIVRSRACSAATAVPFIPCRKMGKVAESGTVGFGSVELGGGKGVGGRVAVSGSAIAGNRRFQVAAPVTPSVGKPAAC